MLVTMKKRKSPLAQRLVKLQERLDLSNAEMAEKFGVAERTYRSWKYEERPITNTAKTLLGIFEQQAGTK